MGALDMDQALKVRKHLGSKTTPVALTVARLLISPSNSKEWINTELCGALVLLVDRVRQGVKVIKMLDMSNWSLIFEQELYVGMKYEARAPYFHCFEIDDAIAGLDFPDDNEAAYFYSKVNSNIPASLSSDAVARISAASSQSRGSQENKRDSRGKPSKFFGSMRNLLGLGSEGSIPEEYLVVSAPTNVRHLQHIGYDPEKGFEVSNIPEEWKALFKSAGLKPKDLKDKETAQAIIQTMAQYSAEENVHEEIQQQSMQSSPPMPAIPSAPPSASLPVFFIPPPPSRMVRNTPAPPEPLGFVTPQPPVSRGFPPPRPPIAPSAPSRSILTPPSKPSAPVQPQVPKIPPKQSESASSAPPVPARSNLLSEIRGGRKLKSVSAEPKLLPDIKDLDSDHQDDLAGKIKMMMMARRVNIKSEPEEDDAEEDNDDEDW